MEMLVVAAVRVDRGARAVNDGDRVVPSGGAVDRCDDVVTQLYYNLVLLGMVAEQLVLAKMEMLVVAAVRVDRGARAVNDGDRVARSGGAVDRCDDVVTQLYYNLALLGMVAEQLVLAKMEMLVGHHGRAARVGQDGDAGRCAKGLTLMCYGQLPLSVLTVELALSTMEIAWHRLVGRWTGHHGRAARVGQDGDAGRCAKGLTLMCYGQLPLAAGHGGRAARVGQDGDAGRCAKGLTLLCYGQLPLSGLTVELALSTMEIAWRRLVGRWTGHHGRAARVGQDGDAGRCAKGLTLMCYGQLPLSGLTVELVLSTMEIAWRRLVGRWTGHHGRAARVGQDGDAGGCAKGLTVMCYGQLPLSVLTVELALSTMEIAWRRLVGRWTGHHGQAARVGKDGDTGRCAKGLTLMCYGQLPLSVLAVELVLSTMEIAGRRLVGRWTGHHGRAARVGQDGDAGRCAKGLTLMCYGQLPLSVLTVELVLSTMEIAWRRLVGRWTGHHGQAARVGQDGDAGRCAKGLMLLCYGQLPLSVLTVELVLSTMEIAWRRLVGRWTGATRLVGRCDDVVTQLYYNLVLQVIMAEQLELAKMEMLVVAAVRVDRGARAVHDGDRVARSGGAVDRCDDAVTQLDYNLVLQVIMAEQPVLAKMEMLVGHHGRAARVGQDGDAGRCAKGLTLRCYGQLSLSVLTVELVLSTMEIAWRRLVGRCDDVLTQLYYNLALLVAAVRVDRGARAVHDGDRVARSGGAVDRCDDAVTQLDYNLVLQVIMAEQPVLAKMEMLVVAAVRVDRGARAFHDGDRVARSGGAVDRCDDAVTQLYYNLVLQVIMAEQPVLAKMEMLVVAAVRVDRGARAVHDGDRVAPSGGAVDRCDDVVTQLYYNLMLLGMAAEPLVLAKMEMLVVTQLYYNLALLGMVAEQPVLAKMEMLVGHHGRAARVGKDGDAGRCAKGLTLMCYGQLPLSVLTVELVLSTMEIAWRGLVIMAEQPVLAKMEMLVVAAVRVDRGARAVHDGDRVAPSGGAVDRCNDVVTQLYYNLALLGMVAEPLVLAKMEMLVGPDADVLRPVAAVRVDRGARAVHDGDRVAPSGGAVDRCNDVVTQLYYNLMLLGMVAEPLVLAKMEMLVVAAVRVDRGARAVHDGDRVAPSGGAVDRCNDVVTQLYYNLALLGMVAEPLVLAKMEMLVGPDADVLRPVAAVRVDRGAELVQSTSEIAWRRLVIMAEQPVLAKMEMLVVAAVRVDRGARAVHDGDRVAPSGGAVDRSNDVVTQLYYNLVLQVIMAEQPVLAKMEMLVGAPRADADVLRPVAAVRVDRGARAFHDGDRVAPSGGAVDRCDDVLTQLYYNLVLQVIMAEQPVLAKMEMLVVAAVRVDRGARAVHDGDRVAPSGGAVDRCDDVLTQLYYNLVLLGMVAEPLVLAKMEMLVVAAVRVDRGARAVHDGDRVAPSGGAVDRCDDVVTQLYYNLVLLGMVAEPLVLAKMEMLVVAAVRVDRGARAFHDGDRVAPSGGAVHRCDDVLTQLHYNLVLLGMVAEPLVLAKMEMLVVAAVRVDHGARAVNDGDRVAPSGGAVDRCDDVLTQLHYNLVLLGMVAEPLVLAKMEMLVGPDADVLRPVAAVRVDRGARAVHDGDRVAPSSGAVRRCSDAVILQHGAAGHGGRAARVGQDGDAGRCAKGLTLLCYDQLPLSVLTVELVLSTMGDAGRCAKGLTLMCYGQLPLSVLTVELVLSTMEIAWRRLVGRWTGHHGRAARVGQDGDAGRCAKGLTLMCYGQLPLSVLTVELVLSTMEIAWWGGGPVRRCHHGRAARVGQDGDAGRCAKGLTLMCYGQLPLSVLTVELVLSTMEIAWRRLVGRWTGHHGRAARVGQDGDAGRCAKGLTLMCYGQLPLSVLTVELVLSTMEIAWWGGGPVIMAEPLVLAKMEMLVVAAVRVDRGARAVHDGDRVAPSGGAVDRCDDAVTQLYYNLVLQVIMAEPLVLAKMEMLVGHHGRAARVGQDGDAGRCAKGLTLMCYGQLPLSVLTVELVLSTMEIAWRRLYCTMFPCSKPLTRSNTVGATRISALHSGSLAVTVSRNRSVGMPCTALRNPGRLGHATSVLGSLVNTWCRKIGVDAFAHQPSLKGATLSQATQAVWATRSAASGCGVDAFVHHWFSTNHR
ncbi:hypothetical protein PHYSODRAFT_297275 [Phytophthora sojae]|uniref:Uncharacterized protein n=1 Tax=Phytophthora sojae (strain P6497) TaxID=1094619 RepID=G4YY07_PHYSP|nr:hypothetical protein PHYSODRAFT_297275 [Phytophthora sojae]EGZ25710.1 hypothetical protein PHYSODRAFT_297275 [Phytophthora sojae]|eukprot:XP_009520998.1 hypothetical protein PHYSODRAFT_297275 [Phytophthora sojae]